jgi:hypothetical protein
MGSTRRRDSRSEREKIIPNQKFIHQSISEPFQAVELSMSSCRYLVNAAFLYSLILLAGCSPQSEGSTPSSSSTPKGKPFVADQVRAIISLGGALSVNAEGNTLLVPVLVDNEGVVDFDSNTNPPVTLGTQLASSDSKVVQTDFIRTNLGLIKAGSKSVISVKLPIAKLVDHEVLILPVQEGVAWFSDFGVVPLKVGPFKACGSTSAVGVLCDSNGASIPVN